MTRPDHPPRDRQAGSGAPRGPTLQARVQADLVASLYGLIPRTVLGVLMGTAVVAWVMWKDVPHPAIQAWIALNVAYACARLAMYQQHRRRPTSPESLVPRTRLWLAGALLLGLVWGSAGIFMLLPDSVEQQSLLVAFLIAISAASLPLEVRHLTALYAFVCPVLLPVAAHLLWLGKPAQVFLAGVTLLVLYGLIQFGRDLNASMREAIERRYENLDLIAALEGQKTVLERARAEAEAADLSKTRFLAAASHDLRQPLHALALFSSALAPHLHDSEARRIGQRLCDSVQALESQFNAILDLSKLDAGVVGSEVKIFALEDNLERIRADFTAEAAGKGIELRVPRSSLWAKSDPVHVDRILRNLVSNAVRYTRHGRVLVACRRCDGQVRIEVWDTGIGIAPSDLPRIWDEFYQAENPERNRQGGFGLGLATVRRLARLLDCSVDVRSEPGFGSVFRFSLPRVAAGTRTAPALAPDAERDDDLEGRVVVVIDDEDEIREATRVLLRQWSCIPVVVPRVEAAFDALGELGRYPDAIVADLQLAGGASGITAVAWLRREMEAEVPALIVTGTTAPDQLSAIHASGLPLLHKPFSAEALQAQLRQILGATAAA